MNLSSRAKTRAWSAASIVVALLAAVTPWACSGGTPPLGTGGTGGGPPQPVCGNGIAEVPWEPCDGSDLGGNSCVGSGVYVGGTMKCTSDCRLDTSGCTVAPGCGNGIIDGTDQCEPPNDIKFTDVNLNGATCQSVVPGSTGGVLGCIPKLCRFDTSGCNGVHPACGNGIIEGSEECDGSKFYVSSCSGVYPSMHGTLACDPVTCKLDYSQCTPRCGNGIIEENESCEGTDFRGDTCQNHGFLFGQLTCSPTCAVDTRSCTGGCFFTRTGLQCY